MNDHSNLLDRVNFLVLGTSLFLYVGLLPNVLFSRYLDTGTVHKFTVGTVATCIALIWITSKFNDTPTRILTLTYAIGLALWVWFGMPSIG